MIPRSLAAISHSERLENAWYTFNKQQISKDGIKAICLLIGENEYKENIFAEEELIFSKSNTMIFESRKQFPFDCLYDKWFDEVSTLHQLVSFFASILFAP